MLQCKMASGCMVTFKNILYNLNVLKKGRKLLLRSDEFFKSSLLGGMLPLMSNSVCHYSYSISIFTHHKHLICQRKVPLLFENRLLRNMKLRSFSTTTESSDSNTVNITYIDRDGEEHHIKGKVGDNVMYLAQKYDLDIEGACEASLACCTCHVYVENFFDKLNEIEEEEEDMLDLAPFLQENSRLSCQIILTKELDGLIVRLPSATRNFYVDGHKPKPH